MRKIFFILSMFFVIVACQKSETSETIELTLYEADKNQSFTNAAEKHTITVKTNSKAWTATVDAGGKDWCSTNVVVSNSKSTLEISVTGNIALDIRETFVTVKAGDKSQRINVKQLGIAPDIILSTNKINVGSNDTVVTFLITANVKYKLVIPETDTWVRKFVKSKSLTVEDSISLTIDNNINSSIARSSEILINQDGGSVSKKITITQEGRNTEYVPGGTGDFKEDIKIPIISATASSTQSASYDISMSYDGNMSTIYHSPYAGGALPVTLEYELNSDHIDYFVYYPRIEGSNGRFKEIEVFVSTASEPNYKSYGKMDFKGSDSKSAFVFTGGLKDPRKIKIVVISGVGNHASCAEIEFYKNGNSSPKNIFTDDLCTDLVSGVTLDKINTIDNEFLRNVAKSIFYGDYNKEFRVGTFKPYQHPDVDKANLFCWATSLLDNTTGIYVDDNSELVLFVGETYNFPIQLCVVDVDNSKTEGFKSRTNYSIKKGFNKVQIAKKGLVYVLHHTSDPSAKPVKIHFASGGVNGYFDRNRHTNADWTRLLNQAKFRYFDVVGDFSHLTFETQAFKRNCKDGLQMISLYDTIVYLEDDLAGFYKYNVMRKNRVYFHVDYGTSYMFCGAYETGYRLDTQDIMTDPVRMRSSMWGVAHEVGHGHQVRNAFRWNGVNEVTNNIYSMYVQKHLNGGSDLYKKDNNGKNHYSTAYEMILDKKVAHNSIGFETSVTALPKLVPFWQLYLYLTEVRGNKDFYKDLHQQMRLSKYSGDDVARDGLRQLEFVKQACIVSGYNLSKFFGAWGFLTPVSVDDAGKAFVITKDQVDTYKAEIAALGLPEPPHDFTRIDEGNLNSYK